MFLAGLRTIKPNQNKTRESFLEYARSKKDLKSEIFPLLSSNKMIIRTKKEKDIFYMRS